MRVMLNGEPHTVADGHTVAQLVCDLGLTARRIAVEINRDILAREDYAACAIREGDAIEIVHFIGGG
jgi:sulfur carrier protein